MFEFDDFSTLCRRAKGLWKASRFADAATLFKRALQTDGGTEEERLGAKHDLGSCLIYLGQYSEAMVNLGEVYVAASTQDEFQKLAYHAFLAQIDTLQKIRLGEENGNWDQQLRLIEEGLHWLYDIGRESWKSGLLHHQACALWELGKKEQAMDVAEDAYRWEKKFGGPGYSISTYAYKLASYARQLGLYERALHVLDEREGHAQGPLQELLLLVERARLLNALEPPQIVVAIAAARRAAELANKIQDPYRKMIAYHELAITSLAANSFIEAHDALRVLHDVSLNDETLARILLLRNAQKSFQMVKSLLAIQEDSNAHELFQRLEEWLSEISQALADSSE